MPAPQRKIPAPFQRPSISVGGVAVKREWRWVYPQQISPGDIVPAVGKVDMVSWDPNDVSRDTTIHGGGDNHNAVAFPSQEKIWAFTKAEYQ